MHTHISLVLLLLIGILQCLTVASVFFEPITGFLKFYKSIIPVHKPIIISAHNVPNLKICTNDFLISLLGTQHIFCTVLPVHFWKHFKNYYQVGAFYEVKTK